MLKFKKKRFFRTDLLLIATLCMQIMLWTQTKHHMPEMGILPQVPNPIAIEALSLGDEQFYFRALAFQLQNAGDTFGRFTALKKYDYDKLYRWFKILDGLDSKSHLIPSLAGYYFSQTQNTADVRYIIDYLDQHVNLDDYNKHHKWWWLSQSVYLANHKLEDKELALKLAYKLAATEREDIPFWAKQMPAFIHEQMGEDQQALMVIKHIMENIETIPPGELNFMRHFVKDRLDMLIAKHPELERLMQQYEVNPAKESADESS